MKGLKMGHMRLGSIPKSRKWNAVVASVAGDGTSAGGAAYEDIDRIASATLEAAEGGLLSGIQDIGLRYSFYFLTQLVLAARHDDWRSRFARLGIDLPTGATLFDLIADSQSAIDRFLDAHAYRSDVSEIAQQAVGDALSTFSPGTASLFGESDEDVRTTVRQLSTKTGFSNLGQAFFGRFMARFLNFYLSRVTAGQVGGTRLPRLGDQTQFNKALQQHCYQSARIVSDFCGEWYSKTEYQTGIDLETTSRFVAIAIKKLRAEIQQQRNES
jgi:hypothetical protein